MELVVLDIRPLSESDFALTLSLTDSITTYVLNTTDGPPAAIRAPHSLWSLLEGAGIESKDLYSLVWRLKKGDPLTFPVHLASSATTDFKARELPMWSSQRGAWRLSPSSLRWAMTHLTTQRSNTLFPVPFEHSLVWEHTESFASLAATIDLRQHRIRAYRQVMAPKSAPGRRPATQLDPLDALLLTAALYELGPTIEKARLSSDDAIVHSFRFLPMDGGQLWDPARGFGTFLQQIEQQLGKPSVSYVVETDISAFYHTISPIALTRQLERIGVRPSSAQALEDIFGAFSSVGLPVGPSPSALLAETVLIATDNALVAAGASFCRFNDDHVLFCASELEANRLLQVLSDALWRSSGLTLQSGKTRVWLADDFRQHLNALHGGWLDRLRSEGIAGDPYGAMNVATRPNNERLVESAVALLQKALARNHPAWQRLSRLAFGSLPATERGKVIELMLRELPRVTSLAPDVSRSIRALAHSHLESKAKLLNAVIQGMLSQHSPVAQMPDYAMTWVLDAFAGGSWPDIEQLVSLCEVWPLTAAPRREMLLAMKGHEDAKRVAFNGEDPWHSRAYEAATGIRWKPKDNDNDATAWRRLLDDVIVDSGR